MTVSVKSKPGACEAAGHGKDDVSTHRNTNAGGGESQAFLAGFGGYHTANPNKKDPKPYTTITLKQIGAMAADPPSMAKGKAQWAIFSTLADEWARGHDYQREKGNFGALWADIDEVC